MKVAYALEEHTDTDDTDDNPFSSSDDSETGNNKETNDSDSETDEYPVIVHLTSVLQYCFMFKIIIQVWS